MAVCRNSKFKILNCTPPCFRPDGKKGMFRGKGKSVAEVDGDSYDLEVVGADEGQDGVAYGRRIDVGLDAAQGVERALETEIPLW